MKDGAAVGERLVRGVGDGQGRTVLIQPDNSSMQQMSYGRIVLGHAQKQISFSNETQERQD
jgi:hypothetical protein